jgi:hypothetical protein
MAASAMKICMRIDAYPIWELRSANEKLRHSLGLRSGLRHLLDGAKNVAHRAHLAQGLVIFRADP